MTTKITCSTALKTFGFILSASLTLGGLLPLQAHAEKAFKANQPVRLVVPFPPGGGSDTLARITSNAVGNMLNEPMIVLNRAGAEGAIGSEYVARAAPDGYTLLMGSADTHSIYPHVYTNAKFDAEAAIAISPVGAMGYVLVGRPELEAKTLDELIKLGKEKQLSYSSWGVGNSSNLAMLSFSKATEIKSPLHVPYQGAGPAAMGVISSQVDIMMMPVPIARAQGDKVIQYGIASPKRSSQLPDLPTLREQSVDVVTEAWIGIVAPPKTPKDVADTLNKAIQAALATPESQKAVENTGIRPQLMSAEEFDSYLRDESAKWKTIVTEANIKID